MFVTSNTGTEATLNWGSVPNAKSYNVQFRPQGGKTWKNRNTTTTSTTVTKLKNGTVYEWRVQADCGNTNTSEWSVTVIFTAGQSTSTCNDGIQNGNETGIDCGGTTCPACPIEPTCSDGIQNGNETGVDCGGSDCVACPTASCNTPTGLTTSNITATRASLSWNAVNGAINYSVQIRPVGNMNWVENVTKNTFLRVQPVIAGTTYEWRVRTNCSGSSSEWSAIVTFTAGSASRGDLESRDDVVLNTDLRATLYPSPASSILNVLTNQSIEQIEIADLTGRIIQQHTIKGSATFTSIDISGLSAGYYFLRIQANQQVRIEKFVKE